MYKACLGSDYIPKNMVHKANLTTHIVDNKYCKENVGEKMVYLKKLMPFQILIVMYLPKHTENFHLFVFFFLDTTFKFKPTITCRPM